MKKGDEVVLGFCRGLFEYFWGRGDVPLMERVEEAPERRRMYQREKTAKIRLSITKTFWKI